jgi:hypothetical protein
VPKRAREKRNFIPLSLVLYKFSLLGSLQFFIGASHLGWANEGAFFAASTLFLPARCSLALLEENFRPRAACANVNLYSFPLDFFFFALALPPPPPPPEKNY